VTPRAKGGQAGMTLTELLVVSLIFVVLTGIVHASFRFETQAFNREEARAMTQGDLRYWLGRIVSDIRKANYDPRGQNSTTPTFTLQSFSQTQLTFTTDLNSNGSVDTSPVETLGYRLNNGSLQLLQNTGWRTVLTGVTNTQLFTSYLDAQGASLDCIALSSNSCDTSQTRSIAAVTMTLTAQASTGGTPGLAKPSIAESATAVFRNPIY
jgi:prepilin-type N-terminal cleavage/methylation domain-containing protein